MRLLRTALALMTVMIAVCAFAQTASSGVVVLGKLAQALKVAPIFASTSTRSRVYYRCQPYEYLVIQPSNSANWFRVLLQNGMYGFVRTEAIARLPYEVTAPQSKPARGGADTASRTRAAVANFGTRFEGKPYKWGGNDPMAGIDCSGFVKFLYGQIGVNLPRTAAEQALVGRPITRLQDLQSGDRLYFWSASRGKVGHTGVYLGNGYFVHSSSGKGGVSTDYLGAKKWLDTLVAARR